MMSAQVLRYIILLSNVFLKYIDAHLPSSCSDLQSYRPSLPDGEYWLNVTQNGASGLEYVIVKLYCHQMDTCSPSEYVTFAVPDTENWFHSHEQRSVTTDDVCALNGDGTRYWQYGDTKYTKIGVNLPLQLDILATTFTTSVGPYTVPYSFAKACWSQAADRAKGFFKVDFSGTGLAISTSTTWGPHGYLGLMENYVLSANRQIISGDCGGFDGGCGILSPRELQALPSDTPPLSSANWILIPDNESLIKAKYQLPVDDPDFKNNRVLWMSCANECSRDINCRSAEYNTITGTCQMAGCGQPQLKMVKMLVY